MYSYTLQKKILRVLLVIVVVSGVSGLSACRYVELYRFSQQFCELEEYITLSEINGSTHVLFDTPVLRRELLLRYLGAKPINSKYFSAAKDTAIQSPLDIFKITNIDRPTSSFNFEVGYHYLNDTPLLMNGTLDPELSSLFDIGLVKPILQSFCTDDYDIEDERIDLRFVVKNIDQTMLPTKKQIMQVFGQAHLDQYRFVFSETEQLSEQDSPISPAEQRTVSEQDIYKQIVFHFTYDEALRVKALNILYYRYDYHLDFINGKGRLSVSR